MTAVSDKVYVRIFLFKLNSYLLFILRQKKKKSRKITLKM